MADASGVQCIWVRKETSSSLCSFVTSHLKKALGNMLSAVGEMDDEKFLFKLQVVMIRRRRRRGHMILRH
jgi:hypothetical protein